MNGHPHHGKPKLTSEGLRVMSRFVATQQQRLVPMALITTREHGGVPGGATTGGPRGCPGAV